MTGKCHKRQEVLRRKLERKGKPKKSKCSRMERKRKKTEREGLKDGKE